MEADVLVVGSGAGGSVIAYHAARRGERTVVLERGPWVRPQDMSHDELAMIGTLYKDGGAQTNTDADMFVLQGACVGGSTVLTNGVCFRLPEDVRARWAADGFELGGDALRRSFERVEAVAGVRPMDERTINPAAAWMRAGAEGLGVEPRGFRKNLRGCTGCGYCNVGCRYRRKLDAASTWIPLAVAHGAEVLPECLVERVEVEGGRARGVVVRDLRDGSHFRVRARRVVLAAGAVGTPELLLKSRIAPGTAGRRTSFNVGSIVVAELPEDVDGFDGDQMGVHVAGDGWLVEQVQNPPASFALTLPGWYDRHHRDLGRYRRMAAAGFLVPTQDVGEVFLGIGRRILPRLFDHAEIRFRLPEENLRSLREAMAFTCRMFLAAGATRVLPPTGRAVELRTQDDVAQLERVVRHQADVTGFGSAHPQGGAVAGDDARRATVDPRGQVHGVADLFVCDASVFPSSTRVNPQLSVMAVADHLVASVLGGEAEPAPPTDLARIRAGLEGRAA